MGRIEKRVEMLMNVSMQSGVSWMGNKVDRMKNINDEKLVWGISEVE